MIFLKFLLVLILFFSGSSFLESLLDLNEVKKAMALYEDLPLWTNILKEKLMDMKNSAMKDPNTNVNANTVATIKLDDSYKSYAEKALKNHLSQNKEELEKNIEKTKELSKKENGSQSESYYIEPNQFRKICNQNTYVLYSRIGGSSKRDMRNPKNAGGQPEGEESFWKVPTCNDLAKCHCCINTCDNVILKKVPVKGGYILTPICVPNVGFGPMGCSPMCKAPIARGACSAYSAPFHEAAYDRDCMGRPAGCEGGGSGCKIIIRDPNNSQFEYLEGGDWKKSKQGDNVVPEGTTVKKLNQINALPPGWIGQLDPEPGKCCKCLQMP